MNVSLPKDLKDWVDEQVEAGGYGTASKYIRDMLIRSPSTNCDDRST